MQPTIFISREEIRAQAFVDVVQNVAKRITCTSLIDFSIVYSSRLPAQGWLFFYSQTGVDFFLQQYNLDRLRSGNLKIAAFGPKTGQHLIDQGLRVNFIGTGVAQSTADNFLLKNKPSRVCLIKGTTSKDSLRPLIENQTEVSSLIVYNNSGKKSLSLSPSDILVFTSPLNLETYYQHYPISLNQKVVVIGTSTAMSGLDLGLEEVYISRHPSLESLATLVLELCVTWSSMK